MISLIQEIGLLKKCRYRSKVPLNCCFLFRKATLTYKKSDFDKEKIRFYDIDKIRVFSIQ
ncbi:hypothetical protein AU377_10905 [Sporosarcina sp. HYO08]|nr:hypothetical protein AU377_10905 [Sporosarcina sp. HYO08]